MYRVLFAALASIATLAGTARAGSMTVSIGPEQVGNGGAYPMAMPPTDPFQWAFTAVTDGGFETTLSLCPGIILGHRFKADGIYVAVGGGIIIDANGVGAGPYSSFGYESGGGSAGVHFTASYTQAIGFSGGRYRAPSAMRFGAVWEY